MRSNFFFEGWGSLGVKKKWKGDQSKTGIKRDQSMN